MRYSPNLPIEEQRRLDQLHLGMGSGNPYREGGLASINPFAVGLFPTPAIQAQPSKDMYDSWTPEQKSEWDRYGEFGKPREVMPQPGPQPDDYIGIPPGAEIMPSPFGPNIDDTYPTGDETRPPVMLPQPIDMPRPLVMLPQPGQENPYPVAPIRPEVMPRPGMPTSKVTPRPGMFRPEVTPRPGPQPFLGTLLPTGQQQSGLTYSDDEKIRPPSIQLSRKHGGSLTQTVLNVLRNLS